MISGRVKKRRIAEIKFYIKKAIKLGLFLIFFFVLLNIVTKLKNSHYFPIKNVKVYGAEYINREEVQRDLLPLVNKGFFVTDVEVIKDKLLQSPWISKVIVQRIWPDQVLITLKEKKPLARWNEKSLLSSAGELFTPDNNSYPSSLPQFIGRDGQQIQMIKYYTKISGLLASLHFKIMRLELTSEQSWILVFNNGMKLSVAHKDVLTRINHFVKVYPKIIGDRIADVEYIDLRYPNGLAVRWKTVT